MSPFRNTRNKMLLVGVWANRNWILGNWLKEARTRSRSDFDILWVPFIYAGKRKAERYIRFHIPKRDSYFFSYITIFESYLKKNPARFRNKSVVLYPHNESEMGDLNHQATVLNEAYKTYFFCSADARQLMAHGLKEDKVEIAYCAVDNDCVQDVREQKERKTVILASRFGPRKGLEALPEVIKTLQDFHFIALGRGWESFIVENKLDHAPNFEYHQFNKDTRNKFFSRAGIFLSLSNLEGGPVPLIEAISMGCIPVATRTGFAEDLIVDKETGLLLSLKPETPEIVNALRSTSSLNVNPIIGYLTWDRITQLMIRDKRAIETLKGSRVLS
jgi:glycosyltransferase involved in cell wall biosynthesis